MRETLWNPCLVFSVAIKPQSIKKLSLCGYQTRLQKIPKGIHSFSNDYHLVKKFKSTNIYQYICAIY